MKGLAICGLLLAGRAVWSQKPQETLNDKVVRLFSKRQEGTDLPIEYREIKGARGQYMWHIGDTHWWIRLHGASGEERKLLDKLDKKKKYLVKGVVLEQNYGVVEVWLRTYRPIEDK